MNYINDKLTAELFWTYIRSGAFQRAIIYKQKVVVHDEHKNEFRKKTKDFLFTQLFLKYRDKQITEAQLLSIIQKLVDIHEGATYLNKKMLKYGNAQKFVNLYLKGMWVAGYLKIPPPHFPVDSIMIKTLGLKANWTNMEKEQYLIIINTAKARIRKTEYKNIAEWEADFYQKNYIDKTA